MGMSRKLLHMLPTELAEHVLRTSIIVSRLPAIVERSIHATMKRRLLQRMSMVTRARLDVAHKGCWLGWGGKEMLARCSESTRPGRRATPTATNPMAPSAAPPASPGATQVFLTAPSASRAVWDATVLARRGPAEATGHEASLVGSGLLVLYQNRHFANAIGTT